ncbi:tetratricopeptide repeat protein (plasmid) [Rhizobium sp. YTUHZ045]
MSSSDPLISLHEGFADEAECATCHQSEVDALSTSHHAKAMAVANDRTVRGDFDDVTFEHDGIMTTFFRRDGDYFVRTQGPDGKQGEFAIKYTFAYEPLQQYLIDLGGGKLQAFDIAWDTEARRWFWLGNGDPANPGSTYHWTGPFYRWNRTCIDCHSTDPVSNFAPTTGSYASSYVATSIGCQSCHGPGAAHIAWARAGSMSGDKGLPEVGPDACFGCHARRVRLVEMSRPDRAFLDQYAPDLMRSELYFPDGQILDEVFEYGSFQRSKMARAGVTCLDCHRPHEGRVKAEGNALCTQCHAETAPDRFADTSFDPSGEFDTPAHTHHTKGSPGAECANCHMPKRTYMKVDPRRDHSFVIPRPDLSETIGTPNACTTCHQDKTNIWAAERLDDWYGSDWRKRPSIAHAFAAAGHNDISAVDALRRFLADRGQPGFVKGSAVTEIARLSGAASVDDVKRAASDPDALVRLGAARAAENLPPEYRLAAIGSLLSDQARAIRIAAVTALGPVPSLSLLGDQRRAFDTAVAELETYAKANADVAGAQTDYGLFLARQGRPGEAETLLRRAIALDPSLIGAHANLAELYRSQGDNAQSQRVYADAVAALPDSAELRYGHGLSLVRTQERARALQEFREASRLDPANSRYRTTLAIALDDVGRTGEAFDMLYWAAVSGASDANMLGTAIQFGLKLQRFDETLKLAEAFNRMQPGNTQVQDLLRQLRAIAGAGR